MDADTCPLIVLNMTVNAIRPQGVVTPHAAAFAQPTRRPQAWKYLWWTWLVVFFEPHLVVSSVTGADIFGKVPLLMLASVGLLALRRYPKDNLMTPLLLIALYAIVTWRFATNPAYAERPAKQLLLYWFLAIGMAAFVKTPKQAIPLIVVCLGWQFGWWGLLGAKRGLVRWHPTYANYDGFGPLMVMGFAGAFHLGMALKDRALKFVAYGIALLCVLGVVSAFARGAALGLALVMVFAWFRSHRKGVMTVGIIVALLAVWVAATLVFTGVRRGRDTQKTFLAEMMTITDTGGTRSDREVLWTAAITIWKERPLIGVGGQSFGPFAASFFKPGEVGGDYAKNPRTLYERSLHNIYVQILCEFGILGSALFLWLFFDFWRKNWRLQKKDAGAIWRERGGGQVELRAVALGMESMMVAFMGCGYFYNQLEVHWLYTLVALNALVYRLVFPPAVAPRRAPVAQRR